MFRRHLQLLTFIGVICGAQFQSEFFEESPGISRPTNHHLDANSFNDIQADGKFVSDADGIDALLLAAQLWKTSNFPTAVATNISKRCLSDSQLYYNAYLLQNVDWASQMFESSGKLPDGLAWSGNNLHAPGLFDECISIKADKASTTPFKGQYCSVFFETRPVMQWELNLNATLRPVKYSPERSNWLTIWQVLELGYAGPSLITPKELPTSIGTRYLPSVDLCIPSSCSALDLRKAVAQLVGYETMGNVSVDGNFSYLSVVTYADENYCFTEEKIHSPPEFDILDILLLVILCILGAVVIAATLLEVRQMYLQPRVNLAPTFVSCFSSISNGRKLLSTKAGAADNLACLNGIRVLSTAWIVLYHVNFAATTNSMANVNMLLEDAKLWLIQGTLKATLAVDTFFVISGLLVAYSLMRELDRNKGRFNMGLFVIHRYIRLTVIYAFILGFIATLLVYVGTGPNWQNIVLLKQACRYNWWNNLLYINNYVVTFPLECMPETWYLACDMQMFILSPLFIYPLWKWKKRGLLLIAFLILGIVCGTIAIFIVWDLPAMGFFLRTSETLNNQHYNYGYYGQLWTRWPPYLVGIALGWLLHITRIKPIVVNKVVVGAGWMVATCVTLAVLFGMVSYADQASVPVINEAVRVSYGSLHRLAWACAVTWMIFACTRGYGGFINRFLSWKVFVPLARLTYVIYLTHFTYLTVYHARARQQYYYTVLDNAQHYFGVVFMVSCIAFTICLTIEVPFLNLEKLLLSSARKADKVEKEKLSDP